MYTIIIGGTGFPKNNGFPFYHVRGYWKGVVDRCPAQLVETRELEFIALHHQMEMVAKRQSERMKQVCK
jgi:hypothetical protein